MATRGCAGKVYAGTITTTTGATAEAADITEWSFEETAEQLDASVMGSCTKAFVAGPVQASGTITCNWSQPTFSGADAEQVLLAAVGTNVKLVLYPAGNVVGQTKYTAISALVTSVRHGASVNGFVQSTFNYFVNGTHTRAAVT